MEEELTGLLLSHVPLTDLVGLRVHWHVQPASAGGFPYINLTRASGQRDYHLSGETGLSVTRIQFDVWGRSFGDVTGVRRKACELLSGFVGERNGVTFHGVFLQSERGGVERLAESREVLFRESFDVQISWGEVAQ